MLSAFQEQTARIIADLAEAEDFGLAGGAALIARGEVDRRTRDLDFFGPTAVAVDRLLPAVVRALESSGLNVELVQQGPGFARLVVTGAADRTEVDLATDARLFPLEAGPGFRVLSGTELAVDKVLAIFGRAEARDFVDLMAIEPQFDLDRLFALALEKDRGFDTSVFAEMLSRFARLRRDEFDLDDERYEALSRRVGIWRDRALDNVRSLGRMRGPDLDSGH